MTEETNDGFNRVFCVEDIARICHEANRALCLTQGEEMQPEWDDAPGWQRESACNGVLFHLDNPEATPEASHTNWMAEKLADGWTYGHIKDPAAKKHPCLIAYEALPPEQRAKDHVFAGIVKALVPFVAR